MCASMRSSQFSTAPSSRFSTIWRTDCNADSVRITGARNGLGEPLQSDHAIVDLFADFALLIEIANAATRSRSKLFELAVGVAELGPGIGMQFADDLSIACKEPLGSFQDANFGAFS